jgi:hypothetical protein
LIPAGSEKEAHYLAALLNSSPCVAALYYTSTGVQTQRYLAADAEKVNIAKYEGTTEQNELAALSIKCHQLAKKDDWDQVTAIEQQ